MIYALPPILGLISLWHGGTGPQAPKVVKNLAWGLTFGGATWFLLYGSLGHGWLLAILSVTAGLICLAGKATGHGRGLGLHEPLSGMPEVLEALTARLIPYFSTYWYKVLILSTAGIFSVVGAALAIGWYNPIAGSVIALGGLLKGSGYMVGQRLEDRKALLRFYKMLKVRIFSNQIGEFLAGFFAGLGLLFADMLI